jgi:acylphosphatase
MSGGSDDREQAAQVRIYGRVQGVWFRGWTVTAATELGLSGWVRNRADGSVEALFVGLPANMETMIAKCHEGPPAARVDELVREAPVTEPLEKMSASGFRQLPDM